MKSEHTHIQIVHLTVDDVRELVADAAREAVLEVSGSAAPALLDQQGLALALDVTAATVRKLVREGMPELRVGCAPRYELDRCIAWLRERGGE